MSLTKFPLRSLLRSGANAGQVPTWSGWSWVPATPALPVWGAITGTLGNQTDLAAALTAAAGLATWGGIGGTLSNQTDLQNALTAKLSSTIPGAGTELQYRAGATSLGAVTGSSFDGSTVSFGGIGIQALSLTLGGILGGSITNGNFTLSLTGGGTNIQLNASGLFPITASRTLGSSAFPWSTVYSPALNSVDGSGTNVVGTNLTLIPGRSTGNATPATVVIQGTVAGSSGSAAQTLSNHLTIGNNKVLMNVPTLDFNNNGSAIIQFGSSYGYIAPVAGSQFAVRSANAAGDGFIIGNSQGGPSSGGSMVIGALHANYGTDLTITSGGTVSTSVTTSGNLHLRGGEDYLNSTTNTTGGKVYIYGGVGKGSGTTGDVYLCHNGSAAVGNVQIGDGAHLVVGTGTGLKIGTATTQKIGFWNVPPVAQQVLATGAGATVDNVISLLQTLGLCRQS